MRTAVVSLLLLFLGGIGRSSSAAETHATDPLLQLSAATEALVTRVSPSVVQVLASGYGPVHDFNQTNAAIVVGRQRSLGSGVIIDRDGYIVTNAHVVQGAKRIAVVLPLTGAEGSPMESLASARSRTVEARLVGTAPEVDIALLKIEGGGGPALPLADYDGLRQGQLVFAFGSPEGLRNSVSMGVVSSVARQPDADHPMVYIQTDAPINPGNSGGPLVNVKGELVGINTFILTESGGSQGLGFAIPSAVVAVAYKQLRAYGHLHQGQIGANLQTVTPELAEGLHLARDSGVLISDLLPGGPAERAGLRREDIVLSVDGRPVDSLPAFALTMYARNAGDRLRIAVLRGTDRVTVDVPVADPAHEVDTLANRLDPEQNAVTQLGILGLAIDDDVRAVLPRLRVPTGVIVVARTDDPRAAGTSLSPGDVIHALNGIPIERLADLQTALELLPPHGSGVLQVEREGALTYLTFALE